MTDILILFDNVFDSVYNKEKFEGSAESVNPCESIRAAIDARDELVKNVAAHMGWSPNNLSSRLHDGRIDVREWERIADFLGYDLKMVDRETGTEVTDVPVKKSVGGRVKMMADKVIYDTNASTHICNTSKFANSFFELFVDSEGRYFIVLYAKWLKDGIVMPVDGETAKEFADVCNNADPL